MNIFNFMIPKSLVVHISSDSTVRQAIEKMKYHRYVAVPVLDSDGVYVGTLRNDDIFKYFHGGGKFDYKSAERDRVTSILDSSYAKPLYHTATLEEMFEKVTEHNFVSVVDDRGCFIGLILRRDVLNFLSSYYKKHSKGLSASETGEI